MKALLFGTVTHTLIVFFGNSLKNRNSLKKPNFFIVKLRLSIYGYRPGSSQPHVKKNNVIITPCSVSLAIRLSPYTNGHLTHHRKHPRFKGQHLFGLSSSQISTYYLPLNSCGEFFSFSKAKLNYWPINETHVVYFNQQMGAPHSLVKIICFCVKTSFLIFFPH